MQTRRETLKTLLYINKHWRKLKPVAEHRKHGYTFTNTEKH